MGNCLLFIMLTMSPILTTVRCI